MREEIVRPTAAAVGGMLGLFAARRLLLVAGATLPSRAATAAGEPPSVALVIAARDEGRSLPRLLAALDAVDYPPQRLFTVVVDDGSTDATAEQLAQWSAQRARTRVLTMPSPVGKAAALNAGIAAAEPCDAVAVCDADLQPEADSLRRLVAPLAAPAVAAVAGYKRPVNASSGPVARYAALESWLMQLVTSAGKDRFGLDPPMLGFAVFRREALEQIGGFAVGAGGEDVAATVSLAANGWRTRFAREAVADDRVVETLGEYVRQHSRWQGNAFDAIRFGSGRRGPETWLLAAGYADRVVLVAAAALARTGRLPRWLPVGYLALRGLEAAVALEKAGARRETPAHLLAAAALFPVDAAASAIALVRNLRRRSGAWRSPSREVAHT
jgi:cellulose synthase/poly-beta-1,6-N-acetylglucosamine synthase-like glycosyltransferase